MPMVIMLFGLPCTGKSSIAKLLCEYEYSTLLIDDYVLELCKNPSKEDFKILSPKLTNKLSEILLNTKNENWVIEMGCLLNLKDVQSLIKKINSSYVVKTILLKVDNDVAIERAIYRNSQIKKGLSKAIIIDEPYNLKDFNSYFETATIEFTLVLETNNLTPQFLCNQILQENHDK